MPHVVAGLATEQSIVIPDKMLADTGIKVHHQEAVHIDTSQRHVRTSTAETYSYDKLFLATGSSPFVPPIEGSELEGVVSLRGLADVSLIKSCLGTTAGKKIVFVGAGFISMEIASLLSSNGFKAEDITVVETMDRVLPLMLDSDMAESVATYLEDKGLTIITGDTVKRIAGNGTVKSVHLGSGRVLEADIVFLSVGVRPNIELAEQIGLELGTFGVKVNQFQETSQPDILAGGDCVEKYNFITGKPTGGQLRGPAVVQGRLAAKRLAGFNIGFPGVLDAGGCQMFDMTITATGLTEERAREENIETVSASVDSRSKHNMIPGMVPWRLKLIFERQSHRLIGGQIVSHAVAPAREIDAVSAFIYGKKTIEDLTTFTSACNPDISSEPSAEPISIAAEQALQKVKQ